MYLSARIGSSLLFISSPTNLLFYYYYRSLGTPLPWSEAKKHSAYVRSEGIKQLINIYNNSKDKHGDVLLWGDEVEYMVISIDDEQKLAKLSLRQAEILNDLAELEKKGLLKEADVTFHPEYGRYMLESTPATPYTGDPKDLLNVQKNMEKRREIAKSRLKDCEIPLTLTSAPNLGTPGQFTEPYYPPTGPASKSLFLPDEIINPHARFPTLTANIRRRRGSKVAINVPIFFDKNTPKPFIDPTIPFDRDLYPEDSNAKDGAALPDHIYMDSMGFGMGCSCLQLTFQSTNINEARNLYDQLAPLTPIMLALTAASPCYRGYLSDQDTRWNVIAGSVDDRTEVERGIKPPPDGFKTDNSDFVIPKSRYDSIDSYLAINDPVLRKAEKHYNDTKFVVNNKVLKTLKENGFDELLAKHFAHLFIRDPIVIFKELLEPLDNEKESDHFENIQSTNWQTLRFKPPPPGSSIGWRVEFRPMEVQLTDFENAAFSVFIVLVTRIILSYNVNFYIPISKVDTNMKVAHHRNAVLGEKFWFRTDVFRDVEEHSSNSSDFSGSDIGDEEITEDTQAFGDYKQLSVDEIINGKTGGFPGLLPIIRRYLGALSIDTDTLCKLESYLSLVSKRASGELDTDATWIRNYIRSHPQYKFDSVVSPEIHYDFIKEVEKLTNGDLSTAGNLF